MPATRRDFLRLAAAAASATAVPSMSEAADRPNIVLIMADDMGFSDLGCFGSEIATPNLDRLAARGLTFTQFYNTARCCPTRASLLTGLYPHQVGIGHMTGDRGPDHPAYRGQLSENCVTVAEVLRSAGYFTAVTGKWHVGSAKSCRPLQRGFDRFYGTPEGGGFYFRPKKGRTVMLGEQVLYDDSTEALPAGWYTTNAWTDYGLEFMDEALSQGKPFFLYLAHNAPHFPLQALPEDIAKYQGKYRVGWDALRKSRHARQLALKLLSPEWPLTPRDEAVPAWDTLSPAQQEKLAQRMTLYAALVDRMDQNVGRVVEFLEKRGVLHNTLLLFLSDNGACAEGGTLGQDRNKGKGAPGSADSYILYGKAWANVSNTPFRLYKHWVHEGGIAAPLIVHWPAVIGTGGQRTAQVGHVIDLLATCCDVGGATYPAERNGKPIPPLEGKTLRPLFEGRQRAGHEALFWEHEGNRAVRQGKWKLVARHGAPWELFDLEADRTELHNLAAKHPEKVAAMESLYRGWAKRCGVEPWGKKK